MAEYVYVDSLLEQENIFGEKRKMFELELKFNRTKVQLMQEKPEPKFTNNLVLLESLKLN